MKTTYGPPRYPLKPADIVVLDSGGGGGGGGGGGSGLTIEQVDDRVAQLLQAGTNVTLAYNDAANTLTINAAGGGGGTGVTDGDKGDIVVSGSGATWMFDSGVVTPVAKTLLDDASTAAMLTTLGAAAVSHTHLSSAIADFQEAVEDRVGASVIAGSNVSVVFDDGTGKTMITAAAGGSGGSGSTQALMETRAVAMATTIDVAVKSLRTGGYAQPGDRGHGLYSRLNVAPASPTNPGYFRSADRFKADETTDSTNGGWWKLAWDGPLRLEQFGGKADYFLENGFGNPTPTDNFVAFNLAMNFISAIPNNSAGPTILLDYGAYYLSDTMVPNRGICLRGMGTGYYHNVSNSRLKFAAGKRGIDIRNGSAGSSVIRDVLFESLGKAGETDKSGIELGFGCEISHCTVIGFGGHGVSIIADNNIGLNANCWYMNHCTIYDNVGHGVNIIGYDANAGHGSALSVMSNGGWGIWDGGFLGNFWSSCHESYNLTGPYYLQGVNAKSTMVGCYNEGYSIPSYVGPNCNMVGGTMASGVSVADGGHWMVGDLMWKFNVPAHRADDVLYIKFRGHDHANEIMTVQTPNAIHSWSYDPNQKVFGLFGGFFTADVNTPITAGRLERLTGGTQGFNAGMWLGGDARASSNDDMRYFGNTRWDRWGGGFRPGTYAVGDTILNGMFAGGNHWAWVCTQAGAIGGGNWAAGINYAWWGDERSSVVTNAGHYYRIVGETLGNETLSENPPTHTSGTATGATDGHTWLYLGDTTAQFRKIGVLDQPTVTGSRGGNAALASLITALASTGVIVDGTTA